MTLTRMCLKPKVRCRYRDQWKPTEEVGWLVFLVWIQEEKTPLLCPQCPPKTGEKNAKLPLTIFSLGEVFKNQFCPWTKRANCTRCIFKNTHRGLIQRLVFRRGSHFLLLLHSDAPTCRLRPCGTTILCANSVLLHSSLVWVNFCFLLTTLPLSAFLSHAASPRLCTERI